MMRGPARWRHRGQMGVSPVIGVVLILGMTVAAGMILWLYRPPLPPSPVTIEYVASGDQSEPAWGDPTDCSNTTINADCDDLPAFFIIFTSHSPDSIPLTSLALEMRCNGTSLVNGTFKSMEVVPGSGANPVSTSPKLGICGTWSPSPTGHTATYFNRLLYFQQVSVGSKVLKNGDLFVIYTHPPADFCDRSSHCPDDDFHGAPPWCFTDQDACSIIITYTANPVSLVATIPFWALSG